MKKFIILFISFINVFASDLNVTIVDFTPDPVSNYFISIFMWATVLLVPFVVALSLLTSHK